MAADIYDQVPYDSHAVSHASLFRMATSALFRGLDAAPPASCRVLELGCADATHLLPLALAYPESRFVGVDRSAAQLDAGRAVAEELGITNLELRCADIAELELDEDPFDYVIAHGVFSWVSDAARERILEILASKLSERGLAYLSYNTLPGWGLRGPLREMLLARTRDLEDPLEKVAAARAHIELLLRVKIGGDRDPYGVLMAEMLSDLAKRSDSYLLHEYLAEHNRAFHVGEVFDALEGRGLRVLADLIRATGNPATHDELEVALYRADLPAPEVEAAADFLTFRQFRASLICRAEVPASLPSPQTLFERCAIAAPLRPVDPEPWGPEMDQRFAAPGGGTVAARTPLLRASLTLLGELWPASIGFAELLERAGRLATAHMSDPTGLDQAAAEQAFLDLMQLRGLGFVDVRAHAPEIASQVSARPQVSPLARLEVRRRPTVANLLHEPVQLEPATRAVASLLDGTRDRAALAAALKDEVGPGPDGEAPSPEQLEATVRECLRVLAAHALLLA